jgi:hypothetical protein
MERNLGKGHRQYEVQTALYSIVTGAFIGEGVGSCSTMESKYRFRKAEQKCPECGKEAIIKGKKEYGGGWLCFKKKGGCGVKFKDGDSDIENQEMGRIEYDNPADYYNTCLKIGKKRSLVDATLTATAASDIFTQDIEDMPKEIITDEGGEHSTTTKSPGNKSGKTNGAEPTGKQKRLIHQKMIKAELNAEDQQGFYAWVNPKTVKEASEFIDQFDVKLETWQKEQHGDNHEGQPSEASRKQVGFNRKMHGLKDTIGDKRYYEVLKKHKFKHSTDVPESKMDAVEKDMLDALKGAADTHGGRNGERDNKDSQGNTDFERYFEIQMENFEETLGVKEYQAVLDEFHVTRKEDVPEEERKNVLKKMMERLDKKNAG